MWFILAPVAHRWDLGPLYVSVVLFILLQRHGTLCLFFMHLFINGGSNIYVYIVMLSTTTFVRMIALKACNGIEYPMLLRNTCASETFCFLYRIKMNR